MVSIAPLLLLSLSAQAQDCAVTSSAAQLAETLAAAETAWQGADEKTFLLKMEEALIELPCVNSPLEPSLAARYHRDLGLWLWVSKQPERAQEAFGAAKRVEPGVGLPKEMAPKGHPVRKMFEGSEASDATASIPRPAAGRVLFDGSEGQRPTQVNTVFQLEAEGVAAITSYLRPDAELPAYEEYVAPPVLKGWHFAAGAGAMLAASGTTLLMARSTHQEFTTDPPVDGIELDDLYNRNRALSTTSAVLAGGAGVLGVVAVFKW